MSQLESATCVTQRRTADRTFVAFDPTASGHRRDVRSAAAKWSSAARVATMEAKGSLGRKHNRNWRAKQPNSERSQSRTNSTKSTPSPQSRESPESTSTEQSALSMDFLLGFDADHCLLCNEILNNTALFHSTVFVLGANYMHVPKTEQLGPDRPGMMWLKTEAINKIIPQLASQDSESARSGTLATAIALLAASELRYGKREVAELHARALQNLVNLGGHQLDCIDIMDHVEMVTDRVVESVLQQHQRSASSIEHSLGLRKTRADSAQSECESGMPSGFVAFRPRLREAFDLFASVEQLSRIDLSSGSSLSQIRQVILHLFIWQPPKKADLTVLYALHHTRAAATALAWLFYYNSDHVEQLACPGDIECGLDTHHQATKVLNLEDFDAVMGTSYQELSFWALWVLSAVAMKSWDRQMLRVLRRFQQNIGLSTWRGVKKLLQRYVYREEHLEAPSKALWARLMEYEDQLWSAPSIRHSSFG